jgi:hypothetical protein
LIHSFMLWIKQADDSAHNSETSGPELYKCSRDYLRRTF